MAMEISCEKRMKETKNEMKAVKKLRDPVTRMS
jgi:hypothetical protein